MKYAGACVAVVGASALGLDYLLKPTLPVQQALTSSTRTPSTTNSSSISSISTSVSSPSATSVQLPSLSGRLFFDYNGNGILDAQEPNVSNAKVGLSDGTGRMIAETPTDASGEYKFQNVQARSYSLIVDADKKFRYMCRSADEFKPIGDGYPIVLNEPSEVNIGLMEGFLTMPLPQRGAPYNVNAYFDEGGDRNWMGQPNGDPRHEGTDFGTRIGTPVYAAAPGVVQYVDDWGPVGIFVIMSHAGYADNMSTLYAHLSNAEVQQGQKVSRGAKLGLSGQDKTHPGPHLHFELDRGFHGSPTRAYSRYTPVDPFKSLWNPNYIGYWTKENEPQYLVW